MFRQAILFGLLLTAAAGTAFPAAPELVFLSPQKGEPLIGVVDVQVSVPAQEPLVDHVDLFYGGTMIGKLTPPDWKMAFEFKLGLTGKELGAVAYTANRIVARTTLVTGKLAGLSAVDVVRVQLFAAVTDQFGKFVPGLSAKDFSLLEDGKPVDIIGCTQELPLLNLAFLLDVSGSMADRMDLVLMGAQRFAKQFTAEERLAVYLFNDTLNQVGPPSLAREELIQRISHVESGGNTAMNDAVIATLSDLEKAEGRKVLLLFSDGRDEVSVNSLEQVLDLSRRQDALIYSIGVTNSTDPDNYRNDLTRLARTSGGIFFPLSRLRNLPGLFDKIREDLSSQYALVFSPRAGSKGVRTLQLRAKDPLLHVRSRSEYWHDDPSEKADWQLETKEKGSRESLPVPVPVSPQATGENRMNPGPIQAGHSE